MSLNKTIVLFLCLLLIPGCKQRKSEPTQIKPASDSKSEITGNISISGAYALYPLVKKWSIDFMKIHPSVQIVVKKEGTGQGIENLQAKKIQLAMISRPLTDEEESEGIWEIPVAKEGVAPIVNQRNPYIKIILEHGISPKKLISLFTGNKPMTWGELLDTTSKEKAVVYTRADESGAAVVWANFLWKESTDLKGIKVVGDSEMIKRVQEDKLSIGYCNFSYAFDSVTGERIKDLNFDKIIDRKEVPFTNIKKAHRGLWLGYYPKNLTRELTFGSIGKPSDPAILEFLKYALTIGQASVASSGFCELNDVYIKNALENLK